MPFTPFDAVAGDIDGLWIIRMKQVPDERGTVRELFRHSALAELDGKGAGPWLQVNVTETKQGAIRGLHGEHMHKLVAVATGEAFGAYVDARPDSLTAGRVVTVELRPGLQVLVPPGVCNGFQSTSSAPSQYVYCFDEEWRPDMPGMSVNPLDPALRIPWPITVDPHDESLLSRKDAALPPLSEVLTAHP